MKSPIFPRPVFKTRSLKKLFSLQLRLLLILAFLFPPSFFDAIQQANAVEIIIDNDGISVEVIGANGTGCADCPPPIAPPTLGEARHAKSEAPVSLFRGTAIEGEIDLTVPGPVFDFMHWRTYDSGLVTADSTDEVPTASGDRWHCSGIGPYLLPVDLDSDDMIDAMDLYLSASTRRRFTKSGNDYLPPAGMQAKLVPTTGNDTKDYDNDSVTTAEDITIYTLTMIDSGDVYVFAGFEANVVAGYRGRCVERTTREYQAEGKDGIRYFYDDTEGTVDHVMTAKPQEWLVAYDYYTGGTEVNRLKNIKVYNGDDALSDTLIMQAEYWYASNADDLVTMPSGDLGSGNDLVQVKVSQLASNGSDWIERTTQYRYYSSTDPADADPDPKGREHQLKMVLEPDAVQRIMDAGSFSSPDDILEKADSFSVGGTALSEYCSRSFTYYNDDQSTASANTPFNSSEDLNANYGGTSVSEAEEFNDTAKMGLVKTETINGICGGCGGGGSLSGGVKRTYHYMKLNTTSSSFNDVVWICVEDTEEAGGANAYRRVCGLNNNGIALRTALIDDPTTTTFDAWCTSTTLVDSANAKENGKIEERRTPSAHRGKVNNNDTLEKFLDPTYSTNDTATLRTNMEKEGLIYCYEYVDSGDRIYDTLIKEGHDGTAEYVSRIEFGDGDNDDPAAGLDHTDEYTPTLIRQYPSRTSTKVPTDRIDTTIEYSFWDDGSDDAQIHSTIATLPAVGTTENGSGVQTKVERYFDKLGRLRWTKDGDGYVNYYSYHPDTGGLAYIALDIDPLSLPTSADATGNDSKWVKSTDEFPVGTSNANLPTRGVGSQTLPTALAIVTQREFDDLGRLVKTIDPPTDENTNGAEHHTVYVEDDNGTSSDDSDDLTIVMHFPYWHSTNKSAKPVQVAVADNGDVLLETYEIDGDSGSVTAGATPALSSSPSQDDYVRWTRFDYDDVNGRLEHADRYHNIPSSGNGTISTDFYRTIYQYDNRGRTSHIIQQVSGSPTSSGLEQAYKFTYDVLDRVTLVEKGVSPTATAMGTNYDTYPTWYKLIEREYDSGNVGNSYLTEQKNYYDSDKYTGAVFHKTFRGHLRGIEPIYEDGTGEEDDEGPYRAFDVDWMNRTTATALYTVEPTWRTDYGTQVSTTSTNRNYLTKFSHDDLSQRYQTKHYPGSQSASCLLINCYYDRRGNMVAKGDKYAAHHEWAFDGADRLYQTRIVTDVSDATPYDATDGEFEYAEPLPNPVFNSMSNGGSGGVIELTHKELDDVGNAVATHVVELDYNDGNGFSLTDGKPTNGVRYSTLCWFDKADRKDVSAYYGCGTDDDSLTTWKTADPPDPSTDPSSSGTNVLVTKFGYDDASRRNLVTDPKGRKTKTFFDALDRPTFVAENQDDFDGTLSKISDTGDDSKDRVTAYEYNGLNKLTKLIAYNGSDTNKQETEYQYQTSTTTDIDVHADLAKLIKYPDGSTSGDDNVKLTYHHDRRIDTREDQRGVIMTFGYDPLRRPNLESADLDTLVSGAVVDSTIQSIKKTYDDLGRLLTVTSYPNEDAGGTAENQIEYTYDSTYGYLAKSEQEHDGVVDGSTPDLDYIRDVSTTSNVFNDGLRLHEFKLPFINSSTKVHNYYGGQGNTTNVNDRLHRQRYHKLFGGSLFGGTPITSEYKYNGQGRMVEIFAYKNSGGGNNNITKLQRFSSGVNFDSYDRFGRIKEQDWDWLGTDSKTMYTYDDAGNRLTRNVHGTTAYDQEYDYDGLHRLTEVDDGDVSSGSISSPTFEQNFTLDQMGNWTDFTETDGTSTTLDLDIDYNDVNEIDDIDTITHTNPPPFFGPDLAVPAYDAAGNMDEVPIPSTLTSKVDAAYDAWNRFISFSQSGPLNSHPINEYDGLHRLIVRNEDNGVDPPKRHFYYNTRWQCVAETVEDGGTVTTDALYSHHPHYIDAVAVRMGSGSTDGIYYLHDANFNVVGLMDVGGTGAPSVKERYHYSAYGEVTILNGISDSDGAEWTVDTDSDFDNELLYTGRRLYAGSGVYNFRNRFYHAQLGRFLNRDPIGYAGGMNLYEYVGGMPTYYVDPWGLDKKEPVPGRPGGVTPPRPGEGVAYGDVFDYRDFFPDLPDNGEPRRTLEDIALGGGSDPSSAFDPTQMALDAAGLAPPPVGPIADVTSAGVAFSKGDVVGGALSLGAAVPIIGYGFAYIKGLKYADECADAAKKLYHGTDEASGKLINKLGLNEKAWKEAAGEAGTDPKGFSLTTDPKKAKEWAEWRAKERGGKPVVLEANPDDLPLRPGKPGEWTDPDELFIAPEDFDQVGPGVIKPSGD